jgi:hypothetical protein
MAQYAKDSKYAKGRTVVFEREKATVDRVFFEWARTGRKGKYAGKFQYKAAILMAEGEHEGLPYHPALAVFNKLPGAGKGKGRASVDLHATDEDEDEDEDDNFGAGDMGWVPTPLDTPASELGVAVDDALTPPVSPTCAGRAHRDYTIGDLDKFSSGLLSSFDYNSDGGHGNRLLDH